MISAGLRTPREEAEALRLEIISCLRNEAGPNAMRHTIEVAFAARDRSLLAEDEEVIEAMVVAGGGHTFKTANMDFMRAALTALRRLKGVE